MAACPTRRSLAFNSLGLGMLALLGDPPGTAGAAPAGPFEALEARHGGRLGIFVVDTGSGRTLAYRAEERFLLCSSFKAILAASVLARVDAGHEELARLVSYGRADLLPASPVTSAHVQAGALSVGALCAAILQHSDNAAANLLYARTGGPQRLTAYARGLGDTVTRFDRTEPDVGIPSGTLDTTTPRAIVGTVRTILLGDVLSRRSRMQLEQWMIANAVGRNRLRAALPASWTIADRTGTSDRACNDYALARPPGRPPLVMAAYYDAPGQEMAQQEAVLREAGAAILAWSG